MTQERYNKMTVHLRSQTDPEARAAVEETIRIGGLLAAICKCEACALPFVENPTNPLGFCSDECKAIDADLKREAEEAKARAEASVLKGTSVNIPNCRKRLGNGFPRIADDLIPTQITAEQFGTVSGLTYTDINALARMEVITCYKTHRTHMFDGRVACAIRKEIEDAQ
jgi:endogenous inhibitor of DNA gyrase (YacG/DUF329 family)